MTVKKVEAKELPELDDDFAQDASEFDTLAEYKADIEEEPDRKERRSKHVQQKKMQLVDKAIENAQMDIPDAMVDTQVRQMLDDFSRRMQSAGTYHGTVLPVHRNDRAENAGRT